MKKFFIKIILGLLYLISLLPLRVHYLFGSILRLFIKNVFRYRYSTIVTNLSRSFPQLKYNEIEKLTNEYYKYMCDLFAESIWDYAHSVEQISSRIEVEGEEIIDKIQKESGRVMIVLGHVGNWEIFSSLIGICSARNKDGFTSKPIYTLYKAAESKFSDMIFKEIREHEYRKFKSSGNMVESKELALHTIRHREEVCTYVLIADQNPIGEHPMIVNFLNQPTAMLRGPEYLSTRGKMGVVYMNMDRIGRGRYKFKFDLITPNAANEEEGFVTKRFASLLERDINNNKVNWLWSHKRWKRVIESD